jgi:HK97 family phage major capsid protein
MVDRGGPVLGIPKFEDSSMVGVVASGNTILTYGDFSHHRIFDRVGMNVEIIPHLFGSSNRYPTGTRGLYAYWRTTSLPTDTAAFRSLRVL